MRKYLLPLFLLAASTLGLAQGGGQFGNGASTGLPAGGTSGGFLRGDVTYTNTLTAAFNTTVGYQINGIALASTNLSDTAGLAYLANAQSFTAQQTFPAGTACSTGSFNFTGQGANTFVFAPSATSFGICISNVITQEFLASGFIEVGQTGGYVFGSGNAGSAKDTGLTRKGPGFVAIGTGASGNEAGYSQGANTAQVVTADVTCGTGGTLAPCTAFTTITGLTFTFPLVAANWSFDCDLIVSQATAAAANQIAVQTATNGATNLTAYGFALTAAAVITDATPITDVASTTTAQSVLTFTPSAVAFKVPIHLAGTVEGVSASGTVLNIQVLTGAAADLLTIYRGSKCWVH